MSTVFLACGGGSEVDGLDLGGGGSAASAGSSQSGAGGAKAGNAGGGAGGSSAGNGGGGAKAGTGGTSAGNGGGGASAGNGGNGGGGAKAGNGGASAGNGGAAGNTCGPTTKDCNKDPADGCETTTSTDPKNCGDCGKVCPGGSNAEPSCKAGLCYLECQTGFSDCNKTESDGCEVKTGSDINNCGTCGTKCATGPNAGAGCFDGKCGFVCTGTYQDCDKITTNGCESDVKADPNNCGACGVQCADGGACVNGGCQCAGTTSEAQLIPLDMYVMFDKSGSMSGSKWNAATSAMKSFIQNPGSTSMSVGMSFFPNPNNENAGCAVASYQTPKVPIALLPGNATALVNAINGEDPDGGFTPTTPALTGALNYAKSYATGHPTHKTIVVFVTDGNPVSCSGNSIAAATAAATAAVTGNPSIPTYVVGVGTSLTNLNSIANGGGTGSAILVNGGDANAFIAAMKAIQGKSLGCEYLIPAPPPGSTFDPNKVNVKLTLNGASSTLAQVANAGACGTKDGWYYDVPAAPTKILLCPTTCTAVQKDTKAKVELELGCSTKKD